MSDIELVRDAKNGSRYAFNELIVRHWKMACAIAISRVGNLHDAEDVAQDAFLTAYMKLENLADEAKFLPWLKAVIVNTARMHFRSKRLIPTLPQDMGRLLDHRKLQAQEPGFVEQWMLADEVSEQLNLCIDDLPPEFRDVIALFYFAGLDYLTIAEVLEIPVSLVRNRLHHGKNT